MDPDLILHFIMALYDMDAAKGMTKDALKKAAKKDEALWNEFKAKNAFQELDARMDRKMNSVSSVAKLE